eukprot:m.499678 g.499678  ORF g.499678 m.499678 type:complete len:90 (-) comp21827_c0_seq2:1528-1797(-)
MGKSFTDDPFKTNTCRDVVGADGRQRAGMGFPCSRRCLRTTTPTAQTGLCRRGATDSLCNSTNLPGTVPPMSVVQRFARQVPSDVPVAC